MDDQPTLKNKSSEALDFGLNYLGLNSSQRESFLLHLTSKQCLVLRNCSYNLVMNSSIAITQNDKNYLKKQMGIIRQLASKKICTTEKRGLLVKKNLLIRRILRILVDYIQLEKDKLKKPKDN